MLQVTKPEIQKLMFLRDVVIPFVKEREKEGKVDFGIFECGTTKCLLGWSWSFPQLGLERIDTTDETMQKLTGKGDVGYSVGWYEIFGTASSGSLDQRAKAIDRLIANILDEVMPKPCDSEPIVGTCK